MADTAALRDQIKSDFTSISHGDSVSRDKLKQLIHILLPQEGTDIIEKVIDASGSEVHSHVQFGPFIDWLYDAQPTLKVAMFNSLASGHFNPARRLIKGLADAGGHINYFTQVEQQAANLSSLCGTSVSTHSYFPAGEVDGRSWFSPDAPSPAGWYNAGIQAWEFGKRTAEAANRTVTWLKWLIDYTKALGVDVIVGEMHAPWGKIVAKSLNLPYVTMCPMRLWNLEECLLQICSEMDGAKSSPWYNPVFEYVRDELDTDAGCRANPREHHRRLYEKLEEILKSTDLYRLVEKEFGVTLTYSDRAWHDSKSCMFMGGYSSLNIQFSGEVFARQPPHSEEWFNRVKVYPVGPFIQAQAPDKCTDPEVQSILTAVQASTEATPVVFVALGTCDSDNISLFRKVISELCTNATPYIVIVRCGDQTSPEELLASAERKTNLFITKKFLPQQTILSHTSVFITHCGMGSLNEALALKVPCLLFPTDIERYGNAVIMDSQGLGAFLLNEIKTSSFHSPLNGWWQTECTKLEKEPLAKTVADLVAASRSKSFSEKLVEAKDSTVGSKAAAKLQAAVRDVIALKGKTYEATEGQSKF